MGHQKEVTGKADARVLSVVMANPSRLDAKQLIQLSELTWLWLAQNMKPRATTDVAHASFSDNCAVNVGAERR